MNVKLSEAVEAAILAKLRKVVEEEVISNFNDDNLEYQPDDLQSVLDDVFSETDEGEIGEIKERLVDLFKPENIEKIMPGVNLDEEQFDQELVKKITSELYQKISANTEEITEKVVAAWHSTYGGTIES